MFRASVRRKRRAKIPALPRGTPHVKVGLIAGKADSDIIERAIYNEFGTRGGRSGGGWGGPIPERPFLRTAVRENRKKYSSMMAAEARMIFRGQGSISRALNRLGNVAKTDVQGQIRTMKDPPNSPVTIERKGSDNPLIATGKMRGAVTYEVEE